MTDNQRGSLFMTLSMAGFAVEDMFLKSAAQSLPVGQVLLVMGLCGALWFALTSFRAGETALPGALLSRTMAVRSTFEVVGRLFYALAIALGQAQRICRTGLPHRQQRPPERRSHSPRWRVAHGPPLKEIL